MKKLLFSVMVLLLGFMQAAAQDIIINEEIYSQNFNGSARGDLYNFDNDGDNSNESSALSNIAGFFIPFVIPSLSTYGITLLMLMVIGLMFFRQNKTMN